ncbi:MAG: molecular chaperone DnaK, partial [Proteobacteria bacterium]|nr:molecular chaperone DnaK [Pseudomonadota bacterium]
PMERTEMWRAIANLERLPVAVKEEIAAELLKHIGSARGEGLNMWVLSRIGSRVPLYGPLDAVIPGNTVTKWIERILATEWKKPDHTGFCVVQMACLTGDRERDIHEQTRHRIRERVIGLKDGERLAKRLNEMLSLSALDRNSVFGESLPEGLHL